MSKKLLIISILFSNVLLFAEHEEAKELFNDAACMDCHNSEDFAHREKKVNNFNKLKKAVDACRYNNGAEWFDDESMDVSRYLNAKHYHYKETAAK